MRKLASVQEISNIEPIEGKDRIVLATVEGWKVIVRKNEFNVGDRCVYIEIDSIMPEKLEFEFLRPKHFKIKTMKMGNVYSQGICFPMSILPDGYYEKGQNVTEILGVKKIDEYQEEADAQKDTKQSKLKSILFRHKATRWLAKLLYSNKNKKAKFPEFISKTDEERIQNIPEMVNDKSLFCATEKIDGTSATYYVIKEKPFGRYNLHVCSRNLEVTNKDTSYWKILDKYKIKEFLIMMAKIRKVKWICLQGEIIGPGIQGNKYKLNDIDFYGFNLVIPGTTYNNPACNHRMPSLYSRNVAGTFGIKWVPIVNESMYLPDSVEEILKFADGTSEIENVSREGIVFRSLDGKKSFKAVSNKFLIETDKDKR